MPKEFEYDELIYRGGIAEVHKVGVRMDDGKVVARDYIHYNGAAVVLPVLDDGAVVMIRNYRFTVDEHLYELPAGMIDDGEDPAGTAARELTEETGYTAGRLEPLGWYYTGPGTTDEHMHPYLATELVDGPQRLETYERITVEIVPEAKVIEMIGDGTIHDAKTIATLALYWLKRGGRPVG